MKLLLFSALALSLAMLVSCGTQKKVYNYIEDFSDTTKRPSIVYVEPVIQKNDLLSIMVYSEATIKEIDAPYNLPNLGGVSAGGQVQGFLVDNEGYIEYPRIGPIKAEGLTKRQLADTIKAEFIRREELKNPTVLVRLLNFKVILMGEVARPGPITVPGERLNVLEAIGLAGDITMYGKKNEVIVWRENNGVLEHGVVDLSSSKVFESPYFQLKQNDIVMVNPTKNKARINEQLFAQRVSLALSIISSIALLYNIFR